MVKCESKTICLKDHVRNLKKHNLPHQKSLLYKNSHRIYIFKDQHISSICSTITPTILKNKKRHTNYPKLIEKTPLKYKQPNRYRKIWVRLLFWFCDLRSIGLSYFLRYIHCGCVLLEMIYTVVHRWEDSADSNPLFFFTLTHSTLLFLRENQCTCRSSFSNFLFGYVLIKWSLTNFNIFIQYTLKVHSSGYKMTSKT
jgi:hypothetical protein